MNLQYFFSALYIRVVYGYLSVKSSGTQQRRVEYIGAVCRGNNDNAVVFGKAVHLNEQLIKRLFALVVSTAEACASMSADGVDFIYEHYGGSHLFCGIEKVSYARRADADVHFHKIGARNREEGHVCFTGNRLCKQGFTCAGRAYKQHASRYFCAEFDKFSRAFKEIDNLFEFLFFLFGARNVGKHHFLLAFVAHLSP